MAPPLQHIFHLNTLAHFIGIDKERGAFELRWTGDNRGIARKPKTLFGKKDGHVHLAIGVFIMKQRNGISALRQSGKGHISSIARSNLCAEAFGVFAAIRKIFRIRGHAYKDITLHTA
jgi:hypothetical protein